MKRQIRNNRKKVKKVERMYERMQVIAYVPGEAVDGRGEGCARLSHQLHASVC